MSLFQKRPVFENQLPLYTLGTNKSVLIVGLGNIGDEYEGTRHNVGFEIIDNFAKTNEMDNWISKKDLKGTIATKTLGSTQVILLKPSTFMNLSGEAVQAVANFYKIPLEQIIVVHDELDIGFGTIRTRTGGSSAGHNGIKSVTKHMGEGYGRVRIGVGPKSAGQRTAQIDSADFVLAKFSKDEQGNMKPLLNEATSILNEYVFGGQLPSETRNFLV
ncbi:MAG: aminoacyl-tRNA hydrolase [Candidatus Saccharimonadales bacterium]